MDSSFPQAAIGLDARALIDAASATSGKAQAQVVLQAFAHAARRKGFAAFSSDKKEIIGGELARRHAPEVEGFRADAEFGLGHA